MTPPRVLAALVFASAVTLGAADAPPAPLPRSSPESQGISSAALLAFVQALEEKVDAVHSVMVLRHGRVVAEGWWEPYRRDDPHELYSLSKSFTSTAVGLAVAEGKLSVTDRVVDHFPDEAPAQPGENLRAMRVRDLLTMSTGQHADDVARFSFQATDVPLTRAFLQLPVAHKPGTHFFYNTPATYMLSSIVQKVTGQTVLEYLRPRFFEPLGIRNPVWGTSPQGVTLGGYGLSVTTEDIARFGQLYLQRGEWQGRRLLPAEWIDEATARQVSNGSNPESDWEQGYGYQFWRCRHGLYRGDGAFGQFCIVMPKQDAVVAITSGTGNMGAVMNVVWDHLLPKMQDAPLPEDGTGRARLQEKLAGLSLKPLVGATTPALARTVAGRTYLLPANDDRLDALSLEPGASESVLALTVRGRAERVRLGNGRWHRGGVLQIGDVAQPAAGTGAWTANDTFTATLCLYETPFCRTLALRFADDRVYVDSKANVAFGPTARPQVIGRRVE